jgi:hypothetical protein
MYLEVGVALSTYYPNFCLVGLETATVPAENRCDDPAYRPTLIVFVVVKYSVPVH